MDDIEYRSAETQDPQALTAGPRRALLCVNPSSRLGRLGIGPAAERFAASGLELVEAKCDDRRDLSPCILAHRHDVDCVIVAGGDGTINAAGKGLVETGLPLGLLPTGTANDFARSVGVPVDLDAAARIIVEGITHRFDVGDVNGHSFFNVASVGLAADLAKSLTRDDKRRFGRFSYAMSAARLLSRATPFHATLLLGQERVMVRTLQIAVGNGRYYGGGNVIARDARIDDGHLDLYSLEFSQVWRMALMIPTFKSGAHGAVREVANGAWPDFRNHHPQTASGECRWRTRHADARRLHAETGTRARLCARDMSADDDTCPLMTLSVR